MNSLLYWPSTQIRLGLYGLEPNKTLVKLRLKDLTEPLYGLMRSTILSKFSTFQGGTKVICKFSSGVQRTGRIFHFSLQENILLFNSGDTSKATKTLWAICHSTITYGPPLCPKNIFSSGENLTSDPSYVFNCTYHKGRWENMAYQYKSRGILYFLHSMMVRLRGSGKSQRIFWFGKKRGARTIDSMPKGYRVIQSRRTGLPLLKKS